MPSELIIRTAIIECGAAPSKRELVQRLLLVLVEDGTIASENVSDLLDCVMQRESLGSTGIGCGVAVPHCKHATVKQPIVMLTRVQTAVDFDSIDAEPTDTFILWLGPRDPSYATDQETMRFSHSLMRQLTDQQFRDRLRSAVSAEELRDALKEVELNS